MRDQQKIRAAEDEPDKPSYIRDRTPLKSGQITTAALRAEYRRDPKLPILLNDDIFLKAIRLGVEQGEFVYRRGELVYGKGDPTVSIIVDEQAVVFTAAYASEKQIWPRLAPDLESMLSPTRVPAMALATGVAAIRTGPSIQTPIGAALPVEPLASAATRSFFAEAILREALMRVFEQARAAKIVRLASLSIRMFDATDAFRLLAAVSSARGPDRKHVVIDAEYETPGGSSFKASFTGSPQEAQPLRDFLEPQFRLSGIEKEVKAVFELYYDAGLAVDDSALEPLIEQLTRFASGTAYVQATAEAMAPLTAGVAA